MVWTRKHVRTASDAVSSRHSDQLLRWLGLRHLPDVLVEVATRSLTATRPVMEKMQRVPGRTDMVRTPQVVTQGLLVRTDRRVHDHAAFVGGGSGYGGDSSRHGESGGGMLATPVFL